MATLGFARINLRTLLRITIVSIMLVVLFIRVSRLVPMQTPTGQQWSVGYWSPNGYPPIPPSQIEWAGLTHVIYWGAIVHADGTLDQTSQQLTTVGPTLVAAAHANGVKVLLGLLESDWVVGGGNTFLPAITNNLSGFVSNIMDTVNNYGFDGVDIDWEQSGSPFAGNPSGAAMVNLLSALRTALGTKLLTAAAMNNDYAFWGGPAQTYLDRVSVMTYDLAGIWMRYSWHNSALYGPVDNSAWSVDLAVRRFMNSGVPAAKLSIGIPFYGWGWSGGGISGPRQYWSGTPTLKQLYYQNVAPMISSLPYQWDASAQVPYLSVTDGSGQFISYDNEQSIKAKINYAQNNGLGGWIIWELSADYLPTQTPNQPLLDTIKNAMAPLATTASVRPSLPNARQSRSSIRTP